MPDSKTRAATQRSRTFSLERGRIDLDSGVFPMVLATDGEASDGDILHIPGAHFPERVPLQNSHWNDTRETLGSASRFRRDLVSTPKKLRAVGQIELAGPLSDVRRDLAHMIDKGHIGAVSVRWMPRKSMRRTDLPRDHYAFVDAAKEVDRRKVYGEFHESWDVLEASLVAVPADREAIIGRAEETEGVVSAFWRSMAEDLEKKPEPVALEARLAAFAAQVRELVQDGATMDDLLSEVVLAAPHDPEREPFTHDEVSRALATLREADATDLDDVSTGEQPPEADATSVEVREEPEPTSPTPSQELPQYGLADFLRDLRNALDQSEARVAAEMRSIVDAVTGKVNR